MGKIELESNGARVYLYPGFSTGLVEKHHLFDPIMDMKYVGTALSSLASSSS